MRTPRSWRVLAGTLALVTLSSGCESPAEPSEGAVSVVVVDGTERPAATGDRARVTVHVATEEPDGGTTRLASAPVRLQVREPGSDAWRTVATATTADSAPMTAVFRPVVTGEATYRAVFLGSDGLPGDRSAGFRLMRVGARTAPGHLPRWKNPVWRDEFNGRRIDRSKWNVAHRTYMSYDRSSLYQRQARVRDGRLVLEAIRVNPRRDRFGRAWASGYLNTRGGKFSQRYGRFEIRAKIPTARGYTRGLWPSFWLRDNRGSGEIDVMEDWGTPSTGPGPERAGRYTWSVHADTNGDGPTVSGYGGPRGRPISPGFHRYAVEWTPRGVRFLFDGRQVGRVPTSGHRWLRRSFPSEVNIRLQLAVGSEYFGFPNGRTKSPARYVIDYVRVWAYRR